MSERVERFAGQRYEDMAWSPGTGPRPVAVRGVDDAVEAVARKVGRLAVRARPIRGSMAENRDIFDHNLASPFTAYRLDANSRHAVAAAAVEVLLAQGWTPGR